jgi:hypothetical protein
MASKHLSVENSTEFLEKLPFAILKVKKRDGFTFVIKRQTLRGAPATIFFSRNFRLTSERQPLYNPSAFLRHCETISLGALPTISPSHRRLHELLNFVDYFCNTPPAVLPGSPTRYIAVRFFTFKSFNQEKVHALI